ncbi:Syntaxin-5 [Thelohanellus kitauei]|uniref:Syntaxin-5 n=1 Tax=Thelohanellus kitauei TaxID=669202 RepID=A0A0C2N606_THEKT|nr:Syntaxin-5 [Thelohanellus kitauei]
MAETDRTIRSLHGKNHRKSILTSLEKKLAHVSKDFKSLLETRTKNFKMQKNRREELSKTIFVPTLINTSDRSDKQPRSRLGNHSITRSDTVIDMAPHAPTSRPANSEASLQDQLMIVQESVPTYLQDRLNAVQTIESTIVELGDIFHQLAHLVNEQEEHIQRYGVRQPGSITISR